MTDLRKVARCFRCAGAARLAGMMAVRAALTVASAGAALLLSAVIDAVMAAISSGDAGPIAGVAAWCCAYAAMLGALTVVSRHLEAAVMLRVMCAVRDRAAAGVLAAQAGDERAQNSAETLTLLGQSMDTLEKSGFQMLLQVFDGAVQALVACVFLLAINPLVGVISLVVTAVPTLVPTLFSRRLGARQQAIVAAGAAYNGRVRDLAQGSEVIRSYHLEGVERRLAGDAARSLEGEKAGLTRTMGWMYGLSNTLGVSLQFLIMALTGWFAVQGLVTLGSIVAVTQLSGQVISPAFELSSKLGELKSVVPIMTQVEALAARSEAADMPDAPATAPVRSFLELSDVTFSYAGTEKPVLRDLSARFAAGEKYAIVGASGGGKSTLLRLVAGQLRPSSGTLRVDGATDAAPDVAFIHQNVFLFDDTLRNNITLWDACSEEDLSRAVHLAGLDDVVAGLPKGLDTPVEENGGRFSGGERQRVAIARALLHKKDVLLVDEATSALDAATAAQVEDAVLGLDGVTVIEVTHHLDPARVGRYAAVYELRDGRLVA